MKPSRKVQAQRKFAQGVQGPSGAANSGSTINEGLIKQPEHNQINVVSVSAHVLLDIISLNNIHSHREPVVLIERLRDSTIKKVQKRTKERVIFKKKRTNNRKSTYTYAWDMKLRSRIVIKDDSEEAMSNKKRTTTRRRRNTSKFSPNVKRRRNSNSLNFTSDDNRPLTYFTTTPENKCTSKDKSILNGGVPKRNINEVLRETKKRMRSKVKRHNNVVMKRKQRTKRTTATAAKAFTVSVSRVRKNLRSHRQRLGCERVPESPDEMVSMSEDTIVDIPADVVLTHQPRDMFDQLPDASINILSNTCLLEADDATVLTVCDTAADMFSDVVMQLPNDAADDNLNKEYHVNVDTQKSPIKEEIQSVKSGCHPTVETAQNSGCRQRNSIEFDDISAYDSQVPYYNEHGIQRWITENLPFPLPNITKVSSENHPSTSSAEHVGVCPANSWRTLKEVVQAPTH